MLCVFVGGYALSYSDYLDRFTGRMLEAEPGFGVYDVDVAPGRNPGLPVPPGDGRWALAPDEDDGADSGNEVDSGDEAGALADPEPPADVPLEPQDETAHEDPAELEDSETEPPDPAAEATDPHESE